MKIKCLTLSAILLSCLVSQAHANDETEKYQQALQQMTGQKLDISSVKNSPVSGIKEIIVKSGPTHEILYLSDDGEFMFQGNLINLKEKQNITEMTGNSMRQQSLNEFKKNHKSIDFFPDEMTGHITVFTDIDCGYCRKLHQEIEQYNYLGIGVSYLFFPRSGLDTASHQKAINVWCSDDKQSAMTAAKSGAELETIACANPIEAQFNLGLEAGIHKVGTPAVIFADGSINPGYLPAAQMKQRIQKVNNTN